MDQETAAQVALMRKKALELRESARVAVLPGYAEEMIDAAEDLEKYAQEIEARS